MVWLVLVAAAGLIVGLVSSGKGSASAATVFIPGHAYLLTIYSEGVNTATDPTTFAQEVQAAVDQSAFAGNLNVVSATVAPGQASVTFYYTGPGEPVGQMFQSPDTRETLQDLGPIPQGGN